MSGCVIRCGWRCSVRGACKPRSSRVTGLSPAAAFFTYFKPARPYAHSRDPPIVSATQYFAHPQVEHHMASKSDTLPAPFERTGSKYSYSLKRWNPFDAWQEHVRQSALSVGSAFAARPDRDLRRVVVAG